MKLQSSQIKQNTRNIYLLDGWMDWLDWQDIIVLSKLWIEQSKEEFSSWTG